MKWMLKAALWGTVAGTAGSPAAFAGVGIFWAPSNPQSQVIFAEVLQKASLATSAIQLQHLDTTSGIANGECAVRATRPDQGEGPLTRPDHYGLCRVGKDDGTTGFITLNLEAVPIHRFGNKFAPKGVSVEGELAKVLYDAFKEVYAERGPSDYLEHNHEVISSVAVVYEFEEYAIQLGPEDPHAEVHVLTCGKEYNYYVNEERPDDPDLWRCDFVYQVEPNGEIR